jgi:5'-nucleotidase
MKRLSLAVLFLLSFSCASVPPRPAAPDHVVLVGTTDLHGWFNGKSPYGGLAVFASYLDALRAANPGQVVVVDSGDLFQGTLESNLFEGEPVVRGYNALGYAAAAVGNHEFDFGPVGPAAVASAPGENPLGALERNVSIAKFPFLSSNLFERGTHTTPSWARRSVIVDAAGAKIGIIGLSAPDTPEVTMEANVTTLDFTEPVAETVREAASLRAAGADAVVVIAHIGGRCTDMADPTDVASCDRSLPAVKFLEALPPGTIDAYFGGHTHSEVRQIINGTPAAQPLPYGQSFAAIDLWIDRAAHRVRSEIRPHTMVCAQVFEGTSDCDPKKAPAGARLVPRVFEGHTIASDPRVAATLAPYLERVAAKRAEKTGITTTEKLERSFDSESPLGDLLTDALREGTGADLAVFNSGGIRTDLRAGELTYGDVFEVSPFDNYPAVVTMSGAEVIEALRITATGGRGLLQVSGLRYTASRSGVTNVTLASGAPLDPQGSYRVAMPDFLAAGGEGLGALMRSIPKERIKVDLTRTIRDLVIEVLRRRPQPLARPAAGRISVAGGA